MGKTADFDHDDGNEETKNSRKKASEVDEVLKTKEQGLDQELIKAYDVDKNTALHIAAQYDQVKVFTFLLYQTDDQHAHKETNNFGKSPIHLISEFGSENCLEVLIDYVNEKKKNKINVNKKDSQGNTPLHLAASNGRINVVKKLLKHDADVQVLDQKGKNALQIAIESKQEEI